MPWIYYITRNHINKAESIMKINYRIATKADAAAILKLYKSQLGREFCPWTDRYPGENEIAFDLSRKALFVMENQSSEIVAAISIDEDPNVDKLPQWSKELLPGAELARLAVDVQYQNLGLAQKILRHTMEELKKRNYKSVHFLVNKHNKKALNSYKHLDFEKVGEVFLYDQPFLCYEKPL